MSKRDETSVWKKELSFRRKPKAAAAPEPFTTAPAKSAETSVWKKEIGFGRKSKAKPESKPAPAAVQSAPKAETSVWKKEVGFGRKKKAAPQYELVPPAGAATAPDEKSEQASVWKKEIGFGRKSKAKSESVPKPAAAPVSTAAAKSEASVWKKEIGFGRKSKAKSESVPKPAAAPLSTAAAKSEASVWKKEIGFGRKSKAKSESKPAPAAVQSAPKAKTSVWKKEIGFGHKKTAAPQYELVPPDGAAPAPDEKPEKASVWKKEIGFGRKPNAPTPPPVTPAPSTVSASEPAPDAPEPPVSPGPEPPVSPAPLAIPAPPVTDEPPLTPAAAPMLPPTTPSIPVVPPLPVVPEPALGAPAPAVPTRVVPEPDVPEPVAAEATPPAPASERPHPAAETVAGQPAQEPDPVAAPRPATEPAATGKKRGRGRREKAAADDRAAKDHNQLVGLKLGASQIAAAQVVNRGGPKVVRMARMPLQRGVVVGGELREPEELASILKAFFRKNKLPRNCVRLGISNNRIGVRTFEISGISDPKQLANAVRFRAQETLPIPLDEAVLDYRILDDRIGDDGDRVSRVLLVVAHKELVERYVAACRKAGLKLVGIDLEAFALLRALSDPAQMPGEDSAVVCVSIGHDRSTLAVSDGRLCEFTRVLAWGGASLDSALAAVLDLTPSAVVPIKHALSLSGEGEVEGLDARHAEEARRAIAGELQSFARELVASLRFYQEQPKSLGIVEILITGGAAGMDGLASELERLIGIPVRIADPLMRVKGQKVAHVDADVSTNSMAVAVGLGIQD